MLIESIRHEPNCPVPLPNLDNQGNTAGWTTYWFIAVDQNNQDSPHVADVTNSAHIARFLKLDHYSVYLADLPPRVVKPVVSAQPPPQHPTGRVSNHPTPIPYAPGAPVLARSNPVAVDTVTSQATDAAELPSTVASSTLPVSDKASALFGMSVRELREAFKDAAAYSAEDLRTALNRERDRKDAPPRASWCDAAEQHLSALLREQVA